MSACRRRNASGEGKHWLIESRPPLTDSIAAESDLLWGRRERALISVDDIVSSVMDLLEATGQINNTYVFYTSDHGWEPLCGL